jgi:two-component system, NarL family, nitrate/nitrite response regulator NarL
MRSSQPLRKIRVFVADSNAIHSELLAEAIERHHLFEVVSSAASSADIHQLVRAHSPDVLLISANLHESAAGGLEVLASLRASLPDLKIVALLESPKREIVVQAFRLGARGVYSKDGPIKTLVKCITCVHEGQVWATAEELGFVLEALATSPTVRPLASPGISQLSTRELDVVNCLAEGLSNREIAERLNLSRHTVKNYMFRIFDKLGVSSRVELLFYALSFPARENRKLASGNSKGEPGKEVILPINGQPSQTKRKAGPVFTQRPKKNENTREPDMASDLSELLPLIARLAGAAERKTQSVFERRSGNKATPETASDQSLARVQSA